jgi:transposase
MATETKNNSQEKVFVGIDVGTRNWAISIISPEGELLERMNIEAEFEILRKILGKYPQTEIHSVYEAGRWGFHLHRQLESIGVKNIITPPNKIPTLTGDLVKTDRRDSLRLATYLLKGLQVRSLSHRLSR